MKAVKKLLSVFLVLSLILSVIPISVSAASVFAGGNGTADNPYQISTATQLNEIRNYSSSNFILNNDIVFTDAEYEEGGTFYNDGYGWEPIENFSGTINGNGFTIENLYVYKLTEDNSYAGLIAVNNGTILNLTLYNCYNVAEGTDAVYSGAFAGINNGTISQCISAGYVYALNGKASYAGGICGSNTGIISVCVNYSMVDSEGEDFNNTYASGGITGLADKEGILTYCYNYGYIYGKTAGGIAGYSEASIVLLCKNDGIINEEIEEFNTLYSGGIVGHSTESTRIQGCVNHKKIAACTSVENAYSGGIVGYNVNSQISDSYNKGKISAKATATDVINVCAGGIVGKNHCDETNEFFNESILSVYNMGETATTSTGLPTQKYRGGIAGDTNCHLVNAYYLTNIAFGVGGSSVFESDAIYLRDSEMRSADNFKGFDFDDMWWLHTESGYYYPQLTLLPEKPATSVQLRGDVSTIFIAGSEPEFTGVMYVFFENSKYINLDASELSFLTEWDVNKIGEQTVTAVYAGYVFDLKITFIKEKPDMIKVKTLPDKTNYVQGQELNLLGISLIGVYDDYEIYLDHTKAEFSYDTEAIGEVEVTVSYQGVTTFFNINVSERIITRISVYPKTPKICKIGEELDPSELTLCVVYQSIDDYVNFIDITQDMVSGYDMNKKGRQSLTVTYQGKTAGFDVYVVDDKLGDTNGDSLLNTLDLALLKLHLAGMEDETIITYPGYADCNCDTVVDTGDLARLKLILASS